MLIRRIYYIFLKSFRLLLSYITSNILILLFSQLSYKEIWITINIQLPTGLLFLVLFFCVHLYISILLPSILRNSFSIHCTVVLLALISFIVSVTEKSLFHIPFYTEVKFTCHRIHCFKIYSLVCLVYSVLCTYQLY